tara:strand:+ start:6780 stop:7127 length:348 start_codon:yes stop_codon:yes gene_type:complete
MATITVTNAKVTGGVTAAEVTLTGTDTFTYTRNKSAVLVLRNPTAGALTPVIDGDGATTVGVAGVGPIDISAGFSVGSIAAGAVEVIRLDTISEYLAGAIAVTGGTGLVATLLEF